MPAYIHTRSYRTLNNVRYKVPHDVALLSLIVQISSRIDTPDYLGYYRHRMISKFTYPAQNLIVFLLIEYSMPANIHTPSYRTLNNVRYEVPHDVELMSLIVQISSHIDTPDYLRYQTQDDLKIQLYCVEFNCISSDIIFCAGLYPHLKLQNFKQCAL